MALHRVRLAFAALSVGVLACDEYSVGLCRNDEQLQPWNRSDPFGASLPALFERTRPVLAEGFQFVWDQPANPSCWRGLGQPSDFVFEVTAEPQEVPLIIQGCDPVNFIARVEQARFAFASVDGLIVHAEGDARVEFYAAGSRFELVEVRGCTDRLEVGPALQDVLVACEQEEPMCFVITIAVGPNGVMERQRFHLRATPLGP
jgi:hypothetical protein